MLLTQRRLLAALCTVGVLAAASSVQAQQHKLLPDKTEAIFTINLDQVLKSDIVKANKNILELIQGKANEELENKGAAKWLKKAGFDLFKDMHSITVAVYDPKAPDDPFIILEGNFDADKIEAAATEASNEAGVGLKVIKIAGTKAFEIAPKGGEKTVYIGILDKKTMIATGRKDEFADAVGRLAGTKKSSLKPEVKAMLETVNNKQSISMIATGPMLLKMMQNAPQGAAGAQQAAAVLQQLDGVSASLTVQKNIDFQVAATAQDNKTAEDWAKKGNGGLAAARFLVAQQAMKNEKLTPVAEVLNTVKVSTQNRNVVVRGQVSFENLTKLLQMIPMPGN